MTSNGGRLARVLSVLVALGAISTLVTLSAGAAAAQDAAAPDNAPAIHAIYLDHLGREATAAEITRFAGLGITLTERDVQTVVLGSPSFYRQAGRSVSKFIQALMMETKGRRATRAEMKELRDVFRNGPDRRPAARRLVANRALAMTGYDRDGFRVSRIAVLRTERGAISRIDVQLNEIVDLMTDSVQVTIDGRDITGELSRRRRGTVASLTPSTEIFRSGRVIASVVKGSDPSVRADKSKQIAPARDEIFPNVRVVAYYGNHQTRLLGVLGETGPEAAAVRVKAAAARFDEPGRPAVGAFEMIATVAQGSAGADGNYSAPSRLEDLQYWIDVARDEGLYVILDIQPGRSDFLQESQRYESLLKQPHVGLALDPEWRMYGDQRPGQVVGSVTAEEINGVSAWLSELVLENDLPEKMFILHQFQTRMIKNRDAVIDRPGLATIIHADGFGGRAIKLTTYRIIQAEPPFWNGFKLFIDEDTRMFQPADVLNFTTVPVPDLITYQ
ncbi:MAG: hypothetical protein HKN94_11225 [Acidimicrobiales bacterium]|nr:hypothetical protein [Acidimicrobiales bacterium]RZV44744.1 MAG: hypothetical protein EX269_11210 [Acidimicrobiales bacterium]